MNMEWKEGHPDQDGQYLVAYGHYHEIRILTWNQHYNCWDDEEGDDNFCDPEDVSHWMPLPEKPKFN